MKAIAEAPSKAIITGEHFVVHGAWALAAALPRRVRAEASPSEELTIVSDRFPGGDSRALAPVASVVRAVAKELSSTPRVRVLVTSDIPEGSGLGSSASTMVAVAAAVARLKGAELGPQGISDFAMAGEREVHGRPSGVDAAVCSRGGVLLFRPGIPPRAVALQGRRALVVAFTGTRRSTRRQITRVAGVKEAFPGMFRGLAEAASEASLAAAERLAEGDMKGLGRILSFNHAVLSAVGASSPSLDRLVDLALSLGAYGAKLTGAGGGGSVIAVAPRGKEKSIVSGLRERGFEAFRAEIPVVGVRSWLEK
jgi:mevalonate kinase